jgi:NAD(P)-dependent dehydrogenase (short-subunit alcohol dehydrogenase family)
MSTKRTVLITGCSDGSLGSHLALQFHAAGWRVFASARNMAKLKLAKEVGKSYILSNHSSTPFAQAANQERSNTGIETIQLDTLASESIAGCVSHLKTLTGGTLDALVNNAGAGYSMPVSDVEISKARDLFELNVWSLIAVTQAFLPLLLASTHQDGALLINHGSLSGVIAASGPFAGAYNASKAAVAGFTETMRLELGPFNIKVLNLVTGAVRSTFQLNAPRPQLPPLSLYAVARETVERAMDNKDDAGDMDPSQWARCVVAQVSQRSPPYWVWAGKFVGLIRWGRLFPVGFFDRFMKGMVGLDVVERNVKAQVQRQTLGGRCGAGGHSDDGKI